MFFLLNDAVLNLDAEHLAPVAQRFSSIGFDYVQLLGQELFAAAPLVHRTHPERAMKLASLIVAKAPEVNAALFAAPSIGCPPDQVAVRFASVDVLVMAQLKNAQAGGYLDPVTADREVWRRMAA